MKKNIISLTGLLMLCLLVLAFAPSCKKDSQAQAPVNNTVKRAVTTSATTQKFIAYFVTDGRNPTYKLTDIPDGVDIVVLFVVKLPNYIDTIKYPASGGYIGAYKSYGSFYSDIKKLQARGIKVIQNIDDESSWQTTKPAGYASASAYALKMKQVLLDQLHLDGITLDVEHSGIKPSPIPPFPKYSEIGYYGWYSASMAANANYINCIKEMTKYFGTTAGNELEIASGLDCYAWNNIASNFVNNFTYFGVQSYDGDSTRTQLMNNYATGTNKIPSGKMVYGHNAETPSSQSDAISIAKWTPTQGQKGGVFVYAFNSDPNGYGAAVLAAVKGQQY
ncbi:endo-beta-N-acetylglucosaminidase F3 [Mucilaginibacter sp. SG564]|uniref:endo-beta-N-acetylglucosaminidase F3 n=1 Tax=Mucilaginibacter sp. SG564 TaxID=2587022 RepID=UPI001557F71D|nr:endo-beta-N-acetylglucosaminidase F3 [Mucilaginibacter sp. SG564]NOW97631.1 hypothetical protein [Mucilaginibacter sp. SG564]